MSARGYVFNKFDSEDYDDITPTSPIMIKTDIFGSIVTSGKENNFDLNVYYVRVKKRKTLKVNIFDFSMTMFIFLCLFIEF